MTRLGQIAKEIDRASSAMFLDKWHYTIAEMTGKTYEANRFDIPVFTYEEVASMMFPYN